MTVDGVAGVERRDSMRTLRVEARGGMGQGRSGKGEHDKREKHGTRRRSLARVKDHTIIQECDDLRLDQLLNRRVDFVDGQSPAKQTVHE